MEKELELINHIKKSLMVIQPIIIEGDLYTPTKYISDLLDVLEEDIRASAKEAGGLSFSKGEATS